MTNRQLRREITSLLCACKGEWVTLDRIVAELGDLIDRHYATRYYVDRAARMGKTRPKDAGGEQVRIEMDSGLRVLFGRREVIRDQLCSLIAYTLVEGEKDGTSYARYRHGRTSKNEKSDPSELWG